MANQAGTNLRHIRDRELSQRNRLRRPASFKVGDLVLVHHARLPSWPRNCLQYPYFGPCCIIRIDGSSIHVRCSPRLACELLCAAKQLRHYHCPVDLSWDEWPLSDSEVERIDLENAASPEEADELEEMTANEMAVNGSCCCYADMQWFCMCKTHFAYYDSLMVVRRYGAASCLLCICQ